MKYFVMLSLLIITLPACAQKTTIKNGDSAIRRIENCICYKSAEGQNLKPWELNWDAPEELRKQFSHCICEVYIDLQLVENPERYIVPGTVLKQ